MGWGNGYVVVDTDHTLHNQNIDWIAQQVRCCRLDSRVGEITYGKIITAQLYESFDNLSHLTIGTPLTSYDIGKYLIGFTTGGCNDNLNTCPKELVVAATNELAELFEDWDSLWVKPERDGRYDFDDEGFEIEDDEDEDEDDNDDEDYRIPRFKPTITRKKSNGHTTYIVHFQEFVLSYSSYIDCKSMEDIRTCPVMVLPHGFIKVGEEVPEYFLTKHGLVNVFDTIKRNDIRYADNNLVCVNDKYLRDGKPYTGEAYAYIGIYTGKTVNNGYEIVASENKLVIEDGDILLKVFAQFDNGILLYQKTI